MARVASRWSSVCAGVTTIACGWACGQQVALVAELDPIEQFDTLFARQIGLGEGRLVVTTSNAVEGGDAPGLYVYSLATGELIDAIQGQTGFRTDGSQSPPPLSVADGVVMLPGTPASYHLFDTGQTIALDGTGGHPILRQGLIAVLSGFGGEILVPFLPLPVSTFSFDPLPTALE
ncbi:MAG: hypothetical protein AAFN41_12340, partial [Planctomycetota bacterium]